MAEREGLEVEVPLVERGTIRVHDEGPPPHLQRSVQRHDATPRAGTAVSGGDEVFHVSPGRATVRLVVFDRTAETSPPTRVHDEQREVVVVAGEEIRIDVER